MVDRRNPAEGPGEAERACDQTIERFLEKASRQFLRSGYAATAVRELALEAGVTVHFVYKHFHDKAGVLGEVLRYRFEHDIPAQERSGPSSFASYVRANAAGFPARATIRALAVEFASVARRDADARRATAKAHQRFLDEVLSLYVAAQARGEIDSSVDPRALASIFWAAELGYGVLEAIGIEAGNPAQLRDLWERFVAALQ